MKKAMSILLSAVMVLGMASCGSGGGTTTAAETAGTAGTTGAAAATTAQADTTKAEPSGDAIVCKLALTVSADHAYAKAYQKMADLIEEKTGGAVKCEMYYDGQMGTDREVIESMQMGMMMGQQMVNQMQNMNNLDKSNSAAASINNNEAATGPNFCPNCGQKAEGARFCPNCGQKLR